MPYSYGYDVKDDYHYTDFGHQENGDGKGNVDGSYRVALPDGRTQIVTYKVNDYSGYVAEVKYEGEAKHPEYKASHKHEYKEHKHGYEGESKHHDYKGESKHHEYKRESKHHEYKPTYKH